MRRWTVRVLHASAVLVSFLLVLEGPDLLLLSVRDARVWLLVGLTSGLLTLPVLWSTGIGFAPPWTLPSFSAETPLRRVVVYHLTCCVLGAWLWTAPTRRVVAWTHGRRGAGVAPGTVPTDVVSVAAGLVLAGLLFLLPASVLFVRLSAFRTPVDLRGARARDLLRPALLAVGSYLLAGIVATVVLLVVTTAGS
ncbi:hypothetical protein C2R22_07540 [Salinigranum rubrum]|uniref:Uncharacterized protein n=1 Tax=Salinigranum rubrum TaxID=755307 RepID=A0A2I8VHY7_9EURY|nr:hypothetical protein [Salinigranum rubrum]AUV81525.1 hypothetical protein C2R22_07540 [Salinigranum rubrum]